MKRLLCIVGSMNVGGAETFLMKLYRSLDRHVYQMDFAVAEEKRGFYDNEIELLGGRIYHISPKCSGFFKNFNAIRTLVKTQGYIYVLRISQHSLSAIDLLAARMGGASVLAFRSSNTNTTGGKIQSICHQICKFMPRMFANVWIAPSEAAAIFMFGKSYVRKKKVLILHNGIDPSLFKFSKEARIKNRKLLNIENQLLIGHIGRFTKQKNHHFLLDVFSDFHKRYPQSALVLIGTGELECEIRAKARLLSLESSVLFLGIRSDVPALFSAFDIFVFPSLYEGMPNTVIEAQANGLPCLIADTITKEANITGLVHYLPLDDPYKWSSMISTIGMDNGGRDTLPNIVQAGYDIKTVVHCFENAIFENNKSDS